MFKLSCDVSKPQSTIFPIQVQIMYVKLISFKARHDELIHELITLQKHRLILMYKAIMRSQLNSKQGFFFNPTGV